MFNTHIRINRIAAAGCALAMAFATSAARLR
jgi:hypothetical protein